MEKPRPEPGLSLAHAVGFAYLVWTQPPAAFDHSYW